MAFASLRRFQNTCAREDTKTRAALSSLVHWPVRGCGEVGQD